MSWVAVGVAGASLVGGIIANKSASDRENDLNDSAFRQYVALKIPDPEKQKLALQRYVQEGKLVPELEQAIKQNPSEFQNIAVDQSQKSAQNRALSSLEQVGNEGGLRLQDKAKLQEAMLQGQVKDRGNRLAISDQMARRGQGGSGFDLQAQLEGQQAAGDREAQSGLSVAASAQDRALKAIEGAGSLATQYRSQDYNEQADRARAQDAINQFNARNLQSVMHSNVGAQNRAQEQNLSEQQRVSDQNVGVTNKEQQYNRELQQKYFDNQMDLANAKSGIYRQQGQAAARQGQQTANTIGNAGQAGVGIAASYRGSQQDQANLDAYNNRTAAMQNGSSQFNSYNPNYSGQLDAEFGPKKKSRYSAFEDYP